MLQHDCDFPNALGPSCSLADLDVISERLREAYKLMTTWEVYKAEVESGYLHWGVVHKSDFFRKYWKRFEGADGKFILLQVSLLKIK